MPIFQCNECGVIENTALSGYWGRCWRSDKKGHPALCSQCDPEIKKWHGAFDRKQAKGMALGDDGFLYSPEHPPHHCKIIGLVEY